MFPVGWPANIASTIAKASATIMRELMEEKVFSLCAEWCPRSSPSLNVVPGGIIPSTFRGTLLRSHSHTDHS